MHNHMFDIVYSYMTFTNTCIATFYKSIEKELPSNVFTKNFFHQQPI